MSESEPQSPGSARARLAMLDARLAARRESTGDEDALPLSRLLELSRSMVRIHDRRELLAFVSDRLRELFDAQNSFVILFDQDGTPSIESCHADVGNKAFPLSATILEQVRRSREPVVIEDTASELGDSGRSSVELLQIASVLCTPLIVDDQVIGALQFDHRGQCREFPIADRKLLSLFADQVASAFHNLELIERLNRSSAEQSAARDRAVQAERLAALGQMAAGITHDFNNTLFIALGLCDVLLTRDDVPSDAKSLLERIQTCSLDAAQTVRRLQGFVRGDRIDTRREVVDLTEIAAGMPALTEHKWRDEASSRGLRLTCEAVLDEVLPIVGDPSEIRELLTNLIFNAVDAMQADGRITISTGSRGVRSFVSVRDEGIGMDEEVLEHIFVPFYTTKGARGHGFGLSTCWSIAHSMHGVIDVRSEPGVGSEFTLWLPSSKFVPAVPKRQEIEAVPAARVLVVDDDREVLQTVCEMLRAAGHEGHGYRSCADALEALEPRGDGEDVRAFDVVMTDLDMPETSGVEFARAVLDAHPDLPVVLFTGYGKGGAPTLDRETADRLHAILPKPLRLNDLKRVLAAALSMR